ncbi:mannose-1-phosphate guanylyltransferase/mannose-6-phosphate isomerase [Cognatazoarcus halotolerans]|uniref:mannose-1-phosphate guanylyltransferase/mannose-6-phosphate isomerase n=1 Tax=Cognatazoarcus halotolerans TaxID=2686016 RepID=UPI001357C80B|nr:mannose-1-phosphate guanylyltransferase/mannose-6-phosphate isomerase [Cognatazoarcus halotolerans]MBX3680252.1 mannose-1-phosphate guanylyltransferase/mannose-6-phosphate isomerase [Rhodocyclaceae bacterium]MCB1902365.1 mannose-1-phosphate guanylyltransferase/mannose-6-phosphate isomerase [Rhodocyclaceae bacterium]MCP5309667.1 mannose-1-phosphate guanylyltransferase/mannose-6-phosphate isomerase [Zoogloeaceae bacterium]
MNLQPVILSGGSGTRLWPLSREQHPKQLLALNGELTMLQATARRMDGFSGRLPVAAEPIVVCNEEYRFITAEQLRCCGCESHRILLEPAGRNTAPALTLAALLALDDGSDPLLLVMPADHVVRDGAAFQRAIDTGVSAAQGGAVVTFGIVPDQPETGYGYIRVDGELADGTRAIAAFVEKPDLETAEAYLASGEYLWNSGLFMMRASVWLKAIEAFNSDMAAACRRAYAGATRDADFVRVDKVAFLESPSDSIDYAVMERLVDSGLDIAGVVVPMAAGWSDVGAWEALWQVAEKDDDTNVAHGDVILEDCSGTLVFADSRLVAGVGLDNVVVVETPDAVLVARKDRTQDVKKIVARLKADQRTQASAHRKVHRPWGNYDSIDNGARFQVKRIVVKPGGRLSLQMHHHRAEHWIVVSGTAMVTRGEESFLLSENQSTYIPLGVTHRLENPGKLPLEMIEVQSGSYLGEDDIVRFEDTYGRG